MLRADGSKGEGTVDIEAVVLAAGLSSRMGRNKLLLNLDNKVLIEHLLINIKKSQVTGINVVTGNMQEEIKKRLQSYDLCIVENKNYRKGMSTSIVAGVEFLCGKKSCDGVLLFNGDMPFIRTETINKLIRAYKKTQALAVVPIYSGRRGHPVLFHKSCFPELMMLKGDKGARTLLKKYKDELRFVEVEDWGINKDIDDMKDYQFAVEMIENLRK